MTMEVKQIEAKDTYKIRNIVLRPNQDISKCIFDGDESDMSFHLGAYIDNELASVASFYMENSEKFENPYQYRLRGMATLPEYQGQGLSRSLLQTAFNLIKRNNVDLLWCNARITAEGFYENCGFTTNGDYFEIPEIGKHIVMSRVIND